jgi:hypothetical protein
MFSVYKHERDAEGREVIEMGVNLGRCKAALVAAPVVFVLAGYFIVGMPLIPMAMMLAFLMAAFAVIGFPFLGMMAKISQLRVTLDSKAGKILVERTAGAMETGMAGLAKTMFGSAVSSSTGADGDRRDTLEIRMAELAKAEFGSSISTWTDSDRNTRKTTVYRLEFVKKNGERVPATASSSNVYSLAHREQMVAVINTALKRQMV